MKQDKLHMAIDKSEQNLMLIALNDIKTKQMQEGTSTDTVDDLILKTAYAARRKVRVVSECEHCDEER